MLCSVCLLLACTAVSATQWTIAINEFMAAPDHGFTDEIGEEEDWIELYNYGDKSLDIAGVAFSDGTSITVIPTGFSDKTTVKHSDYIVLFFDKDTEQGPLHIDAKLSSGGEKIVVIFDQYTSLEHTYGAQEAHVSMGRSPDGTGPFVTMDPSPGGANAVQSSTISSSNSSTRSMLPWTSKSRSQYGAVLIWVKLTIPAWSHFSMMRFLA